MSPTARLPERRTTIETAIKVKVNVKIAYQIVGAVSRPSAVVHPSLGISIWRSMHAEWRVLHIGRIAQHLE